MLSEVVAFQKVSETNRSVKLDYRISSNKHPRRLLKFGTVRCGAK